ncbi:MAG: Stp1/IreP family PP2C-type Ser/Thr phosphatase [Acidimicrobiales bacterium]
MTRLRASGASDVGRVRVINEDRFFVGDDLFVVCDGLGGHQAGEIASQTAVETLRSAFVDRTTEGLVAAVERANHAVWELARDRSEMRGMGTTLIAAALVEDSELPQLAVVNVGDSRAYLFQRDELIQVSEDHSLVEEMVREGRLTSEEAHVHPQRSVITRALGLGPEVEVDRFELLPLAGDRLVLCSDGLTNEVPDNRIAATLRRLADPTEVAAELVRLAREGGGSDNITVVVVDVDDDDDRAGEASRALSAESADPGTTRAAARPKTSRSEDRRGPTAGADGAASAAPGAATSTAGAATSTAGAASATTGRGRRITWRVIGFVTLVLAVLAIAVGAVGWYARHTFYVGIDDRSGRVAIFRGQPGGVLWFHPTIDQRTSLAASDVPPDRLRTVRSGQAEPTLAAAQRYVTGLRQEAATLAHR